MFYVFRVAAGRSGHQIERRKALWAARETRDKGKLTARRCVESLNTQTRLIPITTKVISNHSARLHHHDNPITGINQAMIIIWSDVFFVHFSDVMMEINGFTWFRQLVTYMTAHVSRASGFFLHMCRRKRTKRNQINCKHGAGKKSTNRQKTRCVYRNCHDPMKHIALCCYSRACFYLAHLIRSGYPTMHLWRQKEFQVMTRRNPTSWILTYVFILLHHSLEWLHDRALVGFRKRWCLRLNQLRSVF